MAVTSQELCQDNTTDRFPLLMERVDNRDSCEHVVDIEQVGDASSSNYSGDGSPHGLITALPENGPSDNAQLPVTQSPSSSSNGSNYRSSSLSRTEERLGRRWSPFNTVLWISVEAVFTLGQIVGAILVLCLSGDEHPQTPLFAWIVGHATGSLLSLPLYYWRYLDRNGILDQNSSQLQQDSPRGNAALEPNSYITMSLAQVSEEEDGSGTSRRAWDGQSIRIPHVRLSALMDHYKMALDCFFAVWFVVGNVWIFGGHSSPASEAPKLYKLCIMYLTFSCIRYALPFILCAMVCCCLPCIVSIIGIREDNGVRGATEESINALPTHKFKLRRDQSGNDKDNSSRVEDGGTVASGTEKERAISGEDAVCCICLTKYEDGDDLRELPCSHFFHTDCVDKWLKINASCPLCKYQIAGDGDNSTPTADSNEQA